MLTRRWSGQWDVFILDASAGLLGSTTAATFAEVEHAARVWLGEYLGRTGPARDVVLSVIQN